MDQPKRTFVVRREYQGLELVNVHGDFEKRVPTIKDAYELLALIRKQHEKYGRIEADNVRLRKENQDLRERNGIMAISASGMRKRLS